MNAPFYRPEDSETISNASLRRALGKFEDVEPLLTLCEKGRIYRVEKWLQAGKPIQFPPPDDRKLRRRGTPLEIAVERGFHDLAALLLANGYDPNGDYYEHLTTAAKRRDRVKLGMAAFWSYRLARANCNDSMGPLLALQGGIFSHENDDHHLDGSRN